MLECYFLFRNLGSKMMDFILIILAFVLFFIYDKNQISMHVKWLQPAFFLGCICLVIGVTYAYIHSWNKNVSYWCLAIALVFIGLLIYVLFFALPFSDTYVSDNKKRVCKTGCYALCRHPGFWMLAGSSLFLALSVHSWHMLMVSIVTNIGNFAYIYYQDCITFPDQFADYEEYKREVPFLIFTFDSIKQCIRTWR